MAKETMYYVEQQMVQDQVGILDVVGRLLENAPDDLKLNAKELHSLGSIMTGIASTIDGSIATTGVEVDEKKLRLA